MKVSKKFSRRGKKGVEEGRARPRLTRRYDNIDGFDRSGEGLVEIFLPNLKLEESSIDLVDDEDRFDPLCESLSEDGLGLDAGAWRQEMESQPRRVSSLVPSRSSSSSFFSEELNLTFDSINDNESSICDSKSCCDLGREVDVTRGVCESESKIGEIRSARAFVHSLEGRKEKEGTNQSS